MINPAKTASGLQWPLLGKFCMGQAAGSSRALFQTGPAYRDRIWCARGSAGQWKREPGSSGSRDKLWTVALWVSSANPEESYWKLSA